MGTRERKERETEELREKILLAAQELFMEDGYQNVSMRKIAQKIEYSLPVIYRCFENKAAILSELYNRSMGKLLALLEQASKRVYSDPRERLKAMGHAYMDFALANRDFYELTFLQNVLRRESSLPYTDRGSKGFQAFEVLKQAVSSCKETGFFEDLTVEEASTVLWAGIHGMVSLMIAHRQLDWQGKEAELEALMNRLIKR